MRSTSLILPAAAYLVGLALAPAPSEAAPFDPAIVASDAAWVVHLDVEAALASKLGGALVEHALAIEDNRQQLAMFQGMTGIDPLKELYSVTLYGADVDDPEAAVILIVGSAGLGAALDRAVEHSNGAVTRTDVGYSLNGEASATVFEDRGGRTLMVMAEDEDDVRSGSRVVAGEGTNLTEVDGGDLRLANTDGALAFASIAGAPEFLEDAGPVQAFIDAAEGISVVVREDAGQASVRLELTSQDEAQAQGLANMVQGFMGMARGFMQMEHADQDFAEFKQFGDLLDGITVDTAGRDFSLTISYDVDKLMQLVKDADF